MIYACAKCFSVETWVANASVDSSVGECSFGHETTRRVWPVGAWKDPLARLLEFYEECCSSESGGRGAAAVIQDDWAIFSLSEQDVSRFIEEALGGHPLVENGGGARLRQSSGLHDPVPLWDAFSEEIRSANRYFPRAILDQDSLAAVFQSAFGRVRSDYPLFRARVIDRTDDVDASSLGPPPARLSSAGRANPAGIPYLYLSFNESTCRHEVRAPHRADLVVGEFRTNEELKVLDLAHPSPPDLFVDDAIAGLMQYRYLRRLGDELSRPVRLSDERIDYVPTQYLCEFAKSLGFDGVVYPSAVDPSNTPGRNLVLFHPAKVSWSQRFTRYQVAKVHSTFAKIDSGDCQVTV